MKKTPANRSRNAARRHSSTETETDRFEFARRHIVQRDRLVQKEQEAYQARFNWLYHDEAGRYIPQPVGGTKTRRAKNPDERAELKALEAAYVDARARLLMHDNDGMLL